MLFYCLSDTDITCGHLIFPSDLAEDAGGSEAIRRGNGNRRWEIKQNHGGFSSVSPPEIENVLRKRDVDVRAGERGSLQQTCRSAAGFLSETQISLRNSESLLESFLVQTHTVHWEREACLLPSSVSSSHT